MADVQVPEPSRVCHPLLIQQGARSEAEHLRFKPCECGIPKWDVSTAEGDLSCRAKTPIPRKILSILKKQAKAS